MHIGEEYGNRLNEEMLKAKIQSILQRIQQGIRKWGERKNDLFSRAGLVNRFTCTTAMCDPVPCRCGGCSQVNRRLSHQEIRPLIWHQQRHRSCRRRLPSASVLPLLLVYLFQWETMAQRQGDLVSLMATRVRRLAVVKHSMEVADDGIPMAKFCQQLRTRGR